MGWKDDIDQHQQQSSRSGSDFYEFVIGDHTFRIFSAPVKKVTRFGHGLCYEGAPYCDPVKMEEEYNAKVEKAKQDGLDPKKVSRPNLSVKWTVWALNRADGQFYIVDLPNAVAEKIRVWSDSKDYGFKEFPMPYDVTIHLKRKGQGKTKKDVEYDVDAARKNSEVTEAEMDEFKKKTPIDQIMDRMKNKAKDKAEGNAHLDSMDPGPIDYPEEEINPEDIPF